MAKGDYESNRIRAARLRAATIAYFNQHPNQYLKIADLMSNAAELSQIIVHELKYNRDALFQQMRVMLKNNQISGKRTNEGTWYYGKYDPSLPKLGARPRAKPGVPRATQGEDMNASTPEIPAKHTRGSMVKQEPRATQTSSSYEFAQHTRPENMNAVDFTELNVAGTPLMVGKDVQVWLGKDGSGKLRVFVQ